MQPVLIRNSWEIFIDASSPPFVRDKAVMRHCLENKTSRFPLPAGERMKVRGKTPEIISTLTPALSRQRERG